MPFSWIQQNGFKTANNKPVKHQELFQAGDAIVTEHDIIVYWKKVRGHSRQPGQDKVFNDQTDALAKAGALHGEYWTFQALPPNPSVAAITRRQHATGVQTPTSSHIAISPQFAANDHTPKCGSNTANYGSSHFRPLNSSYFHLRPSCFLRAPHAPLNQAHAASERRCTHVCP